MEKKLTDEQRREFFDQHYPFIEQDEEPPGRAVPNDDGRPGQKWSGKSGWRTRHGTSIVHWQNGRPTFVSGANFADGTVADVQYVGTWRYRISEQPRRWVHGAVDIRPDSVTFTPSEQPEHIALAAKSHPDLALDLASHRALRERLLNADFADALYAYLQNGEFFKQGCDRIWSIGMASAAGIVADLRGQGDVYLDYYPNGGRKPLPPAARHRLAPEEAAFEAVLTTWFSEIQTILAELGWRFATAEDRNIDAAATRRDLASWEARPEGVIADWAAEIRAPRPAPPGAIRLLKAHPSQMTEAERARDTEIATQALSKRLYSLAKSGRISEAEYREMVIRIGRIPLLLATAAALDLPTEPDVQ